jgi:hypothetical protein
MTDPSDETRPEQAAGGAGGPGAAGGPGPGGPGATGGPGGERQMSEEELRAAYEAELKRITIADVLIQTTVSLVNLAGRKLGLTDGTKDERDLEQARDGIDAVRALLPLIERRGDVNAEPLRDALAQLQLAYAREAGAGAGGPGGAAPRGDEQREGEQQEGGGPGPAQSSGRLWIPGQ